VLNPLSPSRLTLAPSRIDRLLAIDWYPIAHALAGWMIAAGRITKAFLYELLRGEESPQMVLGRELPTDPLLAASLRHVAPIPAPYATAPRRLGYSAVPDRGGVVH
jgi:hypothetical protein